MGLFDFFKKRGTTSDESRVKPDQSKVRPSGNYQVILPEERYVTANLTLKGKPLVGIFNVGIMDLTPKEPFSWFLSLMLVYEKTVGDDMPDSSDTIKMQDFLDLLTKSLAKDSNHPNALFLGRITGDGHTQAMWYVNNPEIAHGYLQNLIASGNYPFDFDYQMEQDKDWNEAHYWLDPLTTEE